MPALRRAPRFHRTKLCNRFLGLLQQEPVLPTRTHEAHAAFGPQLGHRLSAGLDAGDHPVPGALFDQPATVAGDPPVPVALFDQPATVSLAFSNRSPCSPPAPTKRMPRLAHSLAVA